ncbi:antitoxin HicB [uncultured Microbacterium sp.]|uniref:antitoxin HicB n=1 Tax=uncultured Microbacterium sp. TaxID=191216 RepID=UPI0026021F00|nr:antitoxin HicB [uncultured Microbacterium sp.]
MNATITAHRWEKGWELRLDGEALTQIGTLDRAEQQVRDYFDTIEPDVDHSSWTIEVIADLGPLSTEIAEARAATIAASEAAASAARRSRQVVRDLRSAGISVTDSAAILGVSRGRISQLANS